MPRLAVIADSNAYIGLSPAALAQIVRRERSNGIVAWASYFVVDELVARSASPDGERSARGIAALRKLAQHCAVFDGVQRVSFLTDPRRQLGAFLFGASLEHDQRAIDLYGTVVQQIGASSSKADWPSWLIKAAESLEASICASERDFVETIWTGMVKTLIPEARDWADVRRFGRDADTLAARIESEEGDELAGRMIARLISKFVGQQPDEARLAWATQVLRESFPLSIRVFNSLLSRVLRRGLDVSRPSVRNTLWDMHLGMSLPRSREICRLPVWLVTGDELIHEAAEAGGGGHLVIRLDDYAALLEDPKDLSTRIERLA